MALGSIPIARSINPDDSVDLTRPSPLNSTYNRSVLDGGWTVLPCRRKPAAPNHVLEAF